MSLIEASGSGPLPAELQARPILTREEMKAELLKTPAGVAGMVWHVGSHPTTPEQAFADFIGHELGRYGFLSWNQGSTAPEAMRIQPYYHPELGLKHNNGKVEFDERYGELLSGALSRPEGIDLSPFGAPGWWYLRQQAHSLPQPRLLKTHLASPSCSQEVLTEGARPWREAIYRALVKGHLANARKIAPVVALSVDDPNPFSMETLRENLGIMFGDSFDGNGRLVSTEEPNVLRAVHSCGDWDAFGAMATKAVDIVHYDAWLYGSAQLCGKPAVLSRFLEEGGLIGWGGVPQNSESNLPVLAERIGLVRGFINPKDPERDLKLAEFLEGNFSSAFNYVCSRYEDWLSKIAKEAGMNEEEIARRTFVSATCGYGSNKVPALRDFSYKLAWAVADSAASSL